MSVDAQAAQAATHGAIHNGPLPERLSISIDSRTIAPGQTFLALRGPNFDGHEFLGTAIARGAAALVLEREDAIPSGVPALVVSDAARALEQLAGAARAHSGARILAITGSAGKTTTKALLHQLLRAALDAEAIATPANENNEIGVAKTLLLLEPESRLAIVEMGCRHFGDIAPLVSMARPEIAIVTNIGDAHLELMGSRERLIETKFGVLQRGATPILNARDPDSVDRARRTELHATWFSAIGEDDAPPILPGELTVLRGRSRIERYGSERRRAAVRCRLPGEHNLANLAAAVAGALALGAEFDAVAAAVDQLELPAGRYERSRIGAFDVIYDAYNASMSGTLATLRAFADESAERRIAVLGSMAELGEAAPAMHRRVGAAAVETGVQALLVGGDFADDLARGAREAGLPAERLIAFEANGEAVEWLRANARAGDLVLLKASRKYRLEEIVEGLRAR
jgi:UDP-N-acetylmuramoyl-tripeptide--D-alanyl-D-alanine ligase